MAPKPPELHWSENPVQNFLETLTEVMKGGLRQWINVLLRFGKKN